MYEFIPAKLKISNGVYSKFKAIVDHKGGNYGREVGLLIEEFCDKNINMYDKIIRIAQKKEANLHSYIAPTSNLHSQSTLKVDTKVLNTESKTEVEEVYDYEVDADGNVL